MSDDIPTTTPTAASADRRSNSRRRTRLRVRFWNDDVEGSGFTADVSDTGLFVQTSMKIDVGVRLHLEIELEKSSFFAEGVVARKRIFPQYARTHFKSGIGLRLVGLGEAIRHIQPEEPAAPQGGLEVDLRDPGELRRIYDRDVMLGGLMVHSDDPPDVHQEVKVRLLLPDGREPLVVAGTVLHIMADLPGLALQITAVDQVRGKLKAIIDAT
jgi:Tfp pilus assembly protein PilZ